MYWGSSVVYKGKAIALYGGSSVSGFFPFDVPWTTCPVNTHDDGTYQCVPNPPILCPANQHNVTDYTCALNPPTVCPANQHNVTDYTCAPNPPTVCPANQHNVTDYTCAPNPPTVCPANQHNVTDYTCAPNPPTVCPANQYNVTDYLCAYESKSKLAFSALKTDVLTLFSYIFGVAVSVVLAFLLLTFFKRVLKGAFS